MLLVCIFSIIILGIIIVKRPRTIIWMGRYIRNKLLLLLLLQYTYFCDSTATYTWIDHCLTTYQNIVSCKIIPRHADNVSDHLPLCLQTRVLSEQCQPPVLSNDVPHGVTCRWDNLECTNTYRDILHSKLSTMHILTCDANDESDAVQGLVDSYVVQLNDDMHDSVTEAGCKQKHCNKPKTY